MKTKTNLLTSLTAAAIVTFGAYEALAQKSSDSETGKIRIQIEQNVNGRIIEIDTSFDANDKAGLEKFLKENNMEAEIDAGDNENVFIYKFEDGDESVESDKELKNKEKEIRKQFRLETDSMGSKSFSFDFDWMDDKDIKELEDKLRNQNFNFKFKMPELPEWPDMKWEMKGLNEAEKEKFDKHMQKAREEMRKAMELLNDSVNFNFRFFNDEEGKETDKEEGYLMLEKLLPACQAMSAGSKSQKMGCCIADTDSKGKKMVVITTCKPSDDKAPKVAVIEKPVVADQAAKAGKNKQEADDAYTQTVTPGKTAVENENPFNGLNVFPNPSSQKFQLEFDAPQQGSLNVRILNSAGQEVVAETYENFSGHYSRQYDLSSYGKGVYLIMIKQNEKWAHKKVVIK